MNRKVLNLILLLCVVAPAAALAQNSVKVQGFVEALPEAGNLGDWLIGGQLVTVGAATEIDAGTDLLQLGACVEAEGPLTAGALEAERLSAKDPEDCGGVGQNPASQKVKFAGLVNTAPGGGLIGSWVIGDWNVASDSFTDFDGAEEAFQAGACVEVKGTLLANGVVRAAEMEVEDDCGATDDRTAELRGIVDAAPDPGPAGDWMVAGLVVRVSDTTEIDSEAGVAAAGACVKAEGSLDDSGALLASQVRVLEEGGCAAPNASDIEFTGKIETVPVNALAGSWTVMGLHVTVNDATELNLELGPAQPGVCVEVEGSAEVGVVTAREIRVLGLDCGAPPAGQTMVTFQGQVQGIPPEGTAGVWRISGRSVVVDDATTVEFDGRDPETGLCVEVEGDLLAAGIVGASRLTLLNEGCAAFPGPPDLTKLTGTIDSLPPGNDFGQWVVGGTNVTVSAATELNADSGDFQAGACVEVEGKQAGEGTLVARKVTTHSDDDCSADGNVIEFAGIVTAKPDDGQIGDWTVSMQQVAVSDTTELDTTDGPLRLGSCVEVRGTAQEDGSIAASKVDVESASGACLLAAVSAGSFKSGPVSPGKILSLFGLGLGPGAGLGLVVENNHVTNRLGGVQVLFDGQPATILYLSGNQVNVVAPYSLAGKTTTIVQVVWAGVFTKTMQLDVAPADPSLLTLDQSGSGQAAVLNWDADAQTYTVNGADNPASPGQAIVLFATGEGQTTPPGDDGAVVDINNLPRPDLPVTVTINGVEAEVFYAGGAPTLVSGVLQVNVFVPEGLQGAGDVEVIIKVGEFSSPAGVTINVQ
jgi:uncharacterized protein (TIGR03437 family)